MIYLDTSAAVKALVEERGTDDVLDLFAASASFVSSRLLAVELAAVTVRRNLDPDRTSELVERVSLVSLSDGIAERAIELRSGLRTLDALHLATALSIRRQLDTFLAYDRELDEAAARWGLPSHPLPGRGTST